MTKQGKFAGKLVGQPMFLHYGGVCVLRCAKVRFLITILAISSNQRTCVQKDGDAHECHVTHTHTCFLNKPSLKCGHSICVVLFICKAKALLAVFGFCLANCTKDALLKAVVVLHNQYWMQPQSLTLRTGASWPLGGAPSLGLGCLANYLDVMP